LERRPRRRLGRLKLAPDALRRQARADDNLSDDYHHRVGCRTRGARIPITAWRRDNATESLTHAHEAGEMILRLHRRPALGIAALPTTRHKYDR
jgi:hypothetical protein